MTRNNVHKNGTAIPGNHPFYMNTKKIYKTLLEGFFITESLIHLIRYFKKKLRSNKENKEIEEKIQAIKKQYTEKKLENGEVEIIEPIEEKRKEMDDDISIVKNGKTLELNTEGSSKKPTFSSDNLKKYYCNYYKYDIKSRGKIEDRTEDRTEELDNLNLELCDKSKQHAEQYPILTNNHIIRLLNNLNDLSGGDYTKPTKFITIGCIRREDRIDIKNASKETLDFLSNISSSNTERDTPGPTPKPGSKTGGKRKRKQKYVTISTSRKAIKQ